MKTIWKGPGFQLVSIQLTELFPTENLDYHAMLGRPEVHDALNHIGLNLVEEKHILVFQGMTKDNETLWPRDGAAMRFFMEPLSRNKDGPVSLCGGGKECSEKGYELGLYRNLVREDSFPHLFYAPVPLAYPLLSTLVGLS